MTDPFMPEYRISVDQLRPGVFIRLEKTSWFDHPFLFSSFKIKDAEQIALLKSLGIREIVCIPERSDVLPARRSADTEPAPSVQAMPREAIDRLWEIKRDRTRRLREKKQRIAACEERFTLCIRTFDAILRGIAAGNPESGLEAVEFVDRLSRSFLDDVESTLHLMNVVDQGESAYSHPMNVAVLSLMVGKEAGLSRQDMNALGLGALFHDIGKAGLPKKLLKKRGELTRPEQELIARHSETGAAMLAAIPGLPEAAVLMVSQHHERMDGSGTPHGLRGEGIDRLARIVAIADAYDNHCNTADPNQSLTPYLALSYMFGQQKPLFDVELLALFIRCLGVYPPGTVVELTNGAVGMVMSVNPRNQLNPSVVLYDADVPKKEALIVDLADEADLRVEKSIRLAHLPPEILEYLSPRTRITYYVDPK
ncbi:HD-GYP domain-containing protein [Pseudodesulfovibrio pelocollis]|uniref:HD-GYP domain-containing protein n=1 Tax=Pseudodesulfovibrio pelocollis TaxID=3051432 RepID=UPI00255AE169|nr:HD-GYP domain-containing protein [Pseudodesulfovibrio sp. SB368]